MQEQLFETKIYERPAHEEVIRRREERKERKRQNRKFVSKKVKIKIVYYNIWMDYKGKKLRILVGVRKALFIGKDYVDIGYAYQSPKDKDNLVEAKKEVKRNIFGIDCGLGEKSFNSLMIKKKQLTPTNIIRLALVYPIIWEDISWVRKSHFLYIEEIC